MFCKQCLANLAILYTMIGLASVMFTYGKQVPNLMVVVQKHPCKFQMPYTTNGFYAGASIKSNIVLN